MGDRQVLTSIRPLSAARVTLSLGLSVASVVLVGLVALYLLALASGALRSVESFVATFGLGEAESAAYHISLLSFLPGFVIVSVVVCGLLAAVAAVAAVLYNTVAELVGGLEIATSGPARMG